MEVRVQAAVGATGQLDTSRSSVPGIAGIIPSPILEDVGSIAVAAEAYIWFQSRFA